MIFLSIFPTEFDCWNAFAKPNLTEVQDAKSTQQKVKESFTDTADRIARGLQPDETKGTAQSAWDKVGAFMIFSSTAVPLLPCKSRPVAASSTDGGMQTGTAAATR